MVVVVVVLVLVLVIVVEVVSLTGCGDLDLGDLDVYRFWGQLSQILTNKDQKRQIKTHEDKY